MIEEGALGQLLSFHCGLQMSLFNAPVSTFPYNWFWDRAHGCSALRNLGSHALNLLFYFFGEVDEVVAQDETCLKEWTFVDNGQVLYPQVEDTATVLLRLRNGGIGTFSTSWSAIAGPGYMLDLFGSKGRMLLQGTVMPATDTRLFYRESRRGCAEGNSDTRSPHEAGGHQHHRRRATPAVCDGSRVCRHDPRDRHGGDARPSSRRASRCRR